MKRDAAAAARCSDNAGRYYRPTALTLCGSVQERTLTWPRHVDRSGWTGPPRFRLVLHLNQYPDRTVVVEGYTDSVGTDDYNQGLSERRADSVKSYLVRQGVGAQRLSALGKGKQDPIAGNDSAGGRQQNRRVEVVISNPAAAAL
jgi:hypothetical protein